MIAEYDGTLYLSDFVDDQLSLVTVLRSKINEDFEPISDSFVKLIDIQDPRLESLFEMHFWVKYKDGIENTDEWLVDESRPIDLSCSLEDGEVIIDAGHSPKDDSWIQYDKGYCAKTISLDQCSEYIVEKIFFVKNNRWLDIPLYERRQVSKEDLICEMIKVRRVNL